MRLRLIHTQTILLLSAVLIAVAAMGLLDAWSLRRGFSQFLAARDIERLEQFSNYIGRQAEMAGGIDELKTKEPDLNELVRRFARIQDSQPGRSPQSIRSPAELEAGAIPRRPSTASGSAFRDRVAIYRKNGEALYEKNISTDSDLYIERPIFVHGKIVASTRMLKLKTATDDVEERFLESQYSRIAFVAIALLLLAWVCAWWVANRWARPLLQIQSATDSIASGNFDVRLKDVRGDEIGDVMRNVNRMADALQKLEQSRRQWIADISHELRTPLSVLRGETDALVEGVRPLSFEAILSLREDTVQLTCLVEDLHLLAMSDLNALPCYFEECDALKILEKVVDRFDYRAKKSELAVSLIIAADSLPLQEVRWDERRIVQLLTNLLDNSLRYTDAPGTVAVRLLPHTDRLAIEIDDSAPGVATPNLSRLFEPLYRADVARSRHTGGSGLGLAICRAIVKAHRGTIEARNSSLGGLQIRIDLPRFVENRS